MEAADRSSIEFRVFGGVEARRDGTTLALGGPRQRALLALLLLDPGRSVSADRLIEDLWAGEPPDGAEVTLRSYVSRLRGALGETEPIAVGAGGYAIEVADEAVDARRFERLLREAEGTGTQRSARRSRDRLGRALALWTGSPYGELAADGALRVEAERLEELRLRAVELRIEADLQLGAAAGLIDELERLVREHPLREALWRQLMLALYRAERQADALDAYHRARAALDEQLGLEPGPELQALQGSILRQDVPPAANSEERSSLPTPLSSFIGRAVELADVIRLLGESRLVTLTGVGGVGKTRLAIEAARARLPEHDDGVVFVDLAPLVDPGLVAGHVALVLDIREQAGVAPVELLANHLRTADLLLVLDNCEHLRDACAELASQLLTTCPDLRLLATSREVLGLPGEVDYPVPPLGLPSDDAPSALRDSESVRLFLARAREARPGLADDEQTIETIARICSDLDGLPLGIELAAARARALSPAEIAARLRDRFRFLVSWRRLSSARHRTLREAMDWSNDLLDPAAQRVLRGLSVFAGGFTLDAVAAVTVDGDEERALELLERLVEASLVTVDMNHDPTRYGVLETVRQYGAEQLAASGETDAFRRLHATHYTTFAQHAWAQQRNAGIDAAWVERIGHERENLRAAFGCHQQVVDGDSMLRLAEAVWRFWWVKGELTEGRAWLATALDKAAESDAVLRARAHIGLGGLAWAHGDLDQAETHAAASLAIFTEHGATREEGNALNTLGLIAEGRHDNVRARALFEASIERLRTAERGGDRVHRNLAVAIDNLGSVAHELGDDDEALARYREALDLNRQRNDVENVAMNELHIAVIEAEAGNFEESQRLLVRALDVYRAVGFRQYAAECLETASIVANGLGSPREAAFFLGAASRLRDDAGAPPVPFMAQIRDREIEAARAALGTGAFDEILDAARRTPSDAAMQRALDFLGAG